MRRKSSCYKIDPRLTKTFCTFTSQTLKLQSHLWQLFFQIYYLSQYQIFNNQLKFLAKKSSNNNIFVFNPSKSVNKRKRVDENQICKKNIYLYLEPNRRKGLENYPKCDPYILFLITQLIKFIKRNKSSHSIIHSDRELKS